MAQIPAKIVNSEQGLVVEASRQSSCAHCKQQDACANQWQINDQALRLDLPNASQLKAGDKVVVECSERTLLHYFALLFLPTLFVLLVTNLLASYLAVSLSPVEQFFILFVLPLLAGALTSKKLLTKAQGKLLAAQTIHRPLASGSEKQA